MFESIVIAVDGSAHAFKALEAGAHIAERFHGRIGVIHVIDSVHSTLPDELRSLGEIERVLEPAPRLAVSLDKASPEMLSSMARAHEDSYAAMLQFGEYLVGEARRSLSEVTRAEVETRVATGNPAEEIVDYARARDADLIVTGCRGLGKLKRLVLGSTSQGVAQLADCSCLTVK